MISRFAYFGSPAFSATILRSLLDHGWKPEIVITEPAKPVGRAKTLTPTAVQQLADVEGLPVVTPVDTAGLLNSLRSLHSLDLLVVAAYGKILPADALTLPTNGAINVHASLLPKYRGASPIQAAILAGDTETGISFMLMEPTLDTGPVLDVVRVPITPTDTTETLTARLARSAAESIVRVLKSYLSDPSHLSHQEDSRATYAPKLTKADGEVRLTKTSPIQLDRQMRAYTPWPGVYTEEFGDRLILKSGRLEDSTYVIASLQWAGKTPVSGAEFARAYPKILTGLPETITLAAN